MSQLPAVKDENHLILIVDDEEAIRMATSDILTHLGYHVLIAQNGNEAVDYCRQYAGEISLILLDMTMPVLSGLETLTALHQQTFIYPVVLMSGYDQQEFNAIDQPANVVGFLKKPFRVEMLVDAVVSALTK
jgi:CheY-like chemotaxis protein